MYAGVTAIKGTGYILYCFSDCFFFFLFFILNIYHMHCVHQGNLQSIDGQPLDNEQQFVLATHPINVAGQQCNVQLFSRDGRYRFKVLSEQQDRALFLSGFN